jgi:hypothetical protein
VLTSALVGMFNGMGLSFMQREFEYRNRRICRYSLSTSIEAGFNLEGVTDKQIVVCLSVILQMVTLQCLLFELRCCRILLIV